MGQRAAGVSNATAYAYTQPNAYAPSHTDADLYPRTDPAGADSAYPVTPADAIAHDR